MALRDQDALDYHEKGRPGKTEVVEFMCEPSGYQYSVATPSVEQPSLRTNLRISLGYRYLGAWIDKWLTLKRLVAEMLSSMSTETDKVVAMGGQPGGLPIRTTFHLWSSLVLSHVYPAPAGGGPAPWTREGTRRRKHKTPRLLWSRLLLTAKQPAGAQTSTRGGGGCPGPCRHQSRTLFG